MPEWFVPHIRPKLPAVKPTAQKKANSTNSLKGEFTAP